MKPNIFDISTNELTQDAFITWLLKWADPQNAVHNEDLNKCATDFIRSLIRRGIPDFNDLIEVVDAGRQWKDIDVWAKINGKYLIVIEDKTYTGKHSKQLIRYKDFATKWCKDNHYHEPICIFLKTGNFSNKNLKAVEAEGYEVYSRKEFVELLKKYNIENDIYVDFKSRLLRIEEANHQWEHKVIGEWNSNDWQGFYQYLEEEMGLLNWQYENNPSGGFWNAVLNWEHWERYPAYLQTEQYQLCFKISTDPKDVTMPKDISRSRVRNELSKLILESGKKKGLHSIRRPKKFGYGNYMTVAVVNCEDWLGDKEKIIDKAKVKERLESYKAFLKNTIS